MNCATFAQCSATFVACAFPSPRAFHMGVNCKHCHVLDVCSLDGEEVLLSSKH